MNFDTVFGFSLALVDGDLVIDDAGRLQQVSGRDNLLQALQLRVLTPFGSDRFNVNYGLDMTATFTQAQPLTLVKQLIQLDLVRSLGTDPRVRDIQDVVFSDDPAYLARHPEIPLQTLQARRAARLWDVEVTIITADGSTATLALTLGGPS
jgi:hypothetical protein